MPPESVRLFIALDLPRPVLDALTILQKRLQTADSERAIRWSAIQGIHLTLKFLGEMPASRQDKIVAAMDTASVGFAPFELTIQGAGCFPNFNKPRVIWAGCNGNLRALLALQEQVERVIMPLGFPTDERGFSPHLTLGRARQEASGKALAALGQLVKSVESSSLAAWQVEGVSLMRSDLKPSGAVYTQVAYWPLG